MATLDFWGILNLINKEFAAYLPVLNKPGIFDVFVRYATAKSSGVDPWTSDQFLSELHNTPYYKESSDVARQWDMLQATDPATASTRVEAAKRQIEDVQQSSGIRLNNQDGTGFSFLVEAVRNNWNADEIKYRMMASVNTYGGSGGELGQHAAEIKGLANDYGVPLSDKTALFYAKKMIQGADNAASIKGYFVESAKSLYPAMFDQLNRGYTVRQVAEPYIQLAQQELGIDPSTVNLLDPKFMKMFNQVDQKSGARIIMPLDSALQYMRSDASFGYDTTAQGRQSATTLATQLQAKFGAA